jgi:hypothetical protein
MKFEIHFEFRASLRKFQDLNFWDATLVIILFLRMLEEEAGHQPMWEAEPRHSSLSTTARLMAAHLQQRKDKTGSTNPLGRTKGMNSLATSSPGKMAPAQILPPNAGASHPSRRHTMSSTHSVWACSR